MPDMNAILLSRDLLAASQLVAAARAVDCELQAAADVPTALRHIAAGNAQLVIIDLTSVGVDDIARIRRELPGQPGTPFLAAYGPHVQAARLAKARDAGCDRVLTRGQIVESLPELVAAARQAPGA